MKPIVGIPVSWSLYWAGHCASRLMNLIPDSYQGRFTKWLYSAYRVCMVTSESIQGSAAWGPWVNGDD